VTHNYNPYRDSPYLGMSPEDVEEMMIRRRNREIQRELKEDWEAECRRDEEVIRKLEK
jgi:hypothetical protein